MRARDLLIRGVGALAVLVVANVAVWAGAKNALPRQLVRRAQKMASPTHIFLGNSTMASGVDEAAFAAAMPGSRPLNIALRATFPVEHYLLYRQFQAPRGAWLAYGFIDTQLTDTPQGSWSTLSGSRSLVYYLDPEIAFEMYSPGGGWRTSLLRMTSHVPVLVNRGAIWGRVERVRRGLEKIGQPPRAESRFGRAVDFALLEPEPAEFASRCERVVREQTQFNRPVAEIFGRAIAQGNPIVVIEMPMTLLHRQRCYTGPAWAAYRQHLRALVSGVGAIYLDASDWLPDEAFSDGLHVNEQWAARFSARLAQWFASVPGPAPAKAQ